MTQLRLTRCEHYIANAGVYVECGKVRSAPCSAVCRMDVEVPRERAEVEG